MNSEAEKSTFSKPWGSRTWAGEAHIAPYGLFDSACFLSKSISFFVLENFWAPGKPPCMQMETVVSVKENTSYIY